MIFMNNIKSQLLIASFVSKAKPTKVVLIIEKLQ